MTWHPPEVEPRRFGVYRVQVPVPAFLEAKPKPELARFARFIGYWTCWAPTPEGARWLYIRGPSAGYTWAEL